MEAAALVLEQQLDLHSGMGPRSYHWSCVCCVFKWLLTELGLWLLLREMGQWLLQSWLGQAAPHPELSQG